MSFLDKLKNLFVMKDLWIEIVKRDFVSNLGIWLDRTSWPSPQSLPKTRTASHIYINQGACV